MAGEDPRGAVVDALLRVHRENGYSQIVLDAVLQRAAFSPQDTSLVSRLFYGVIERQLTLDYVIGECSSAPLSRLHPAVLEILRSGIYQLLYMDKIPARAAVSESVRLTRAFRQAYAAGFVNALLRRVDRQRETLFDRLPAGAAGDAVRYGVPAHWITAWQSSYGEETTAGLLAAFSETAPQCIRVNTLQISADAFCECLQNAAVPFTRQEDLPDSIQIPAGFRLKGLAKIKENWYYYQDTASQYCCRALAAQPGERIADVCAAPGGKSFTLAQMMQNSGFLLSGDVHAAKCDTVSRRAAALGITCLQAAPRDASQPVPPALCSSFDRVLCDAPCSGLGVIRRKPEIRYKTLADTAALPDLQRRILDSAAAMVKPGGVLQYSTCTLRPEENEMVADAFLAAHPDFSPRLLPLPSCFAAAGLPPSHQITLFPHIHHTDGFFIAAFRRSPSEG